jgi:cell division protein FtsB
MIDLPSLYAVIGAKEVHICRLNAAIAEAHEEIQKLKASVAAMEREFAQLRQPTPPGTEVPPPVPSGGL